MKSYNLSIILTLLVSFYNSAHAECGNKGARNTFLWSVRHPQTNSRGFLFGTIHVPYTEVWDRVSDRVREAFSFSDTVLLEIDLRNEYTVRRLIRCKNLRRKQTAASYLDPKLYQRIKDFMGRFRRSLISWAHSREADNPYLYKKAKDMYESLVGNWDRKRPEWLLFALYQLCENLLDRPTSPMLDVFLANKAHEEDKQIRAIETTQEQCNPIRSLSQQEIIFAINYTIAYLEHLHVTERLFEINNGRSISALVKEYRCGNLDDNYFRMNELSITGFEAGEKDRELAEKIDRQLREDIIARRNERMANRLHHILSSNPRLTVFSAIGTGHLFGNDSVLHHLQNMGYVVENVRDQDSILPPRSPSRDFKFNSLWLRHQPEAPNVSIEVIMANSASAWLHICMLMSLMQVW